MTRTLLLVLVCGAVSCTFPDVQVDSNGTDARPSDQGVLDVSEDHEADGVDSTLPEDTAIDSVVTSDGGDATPDTGCKKPCDCDGDGHKAKTGGCGGDDCDDDDDRAFPGQDFLSDKPNPLTTKGDWNCDTTITPKFKIGFSCGALGLIGCTGTQGFTDTPGCGDLSPNFITCKSNTVACVVDAKTSAYQWCK